MTIRGQIIACLRDAGRPLDYVRVATRIGRSLAYTKAVVAQLHQAGAIRVVGSVAGVKAPRSTYRPTTAGLATLAPGYVPQRVGAATREAKRRAAQPPRPAPPARRTPAAPGALWEVWR